MIHLLFILTTIVLLFTIRSTPKMHPGFIWGFLQLIMFIGTYLITDPHDQIEFEHFVIYSVFIFIYSLLFYISKGKAHIKILEITYYDIKYVKYLLFISITMTSFYYFLAESNLLVEVFNSLFKTKYLIENISDSRYSFYSGDKYLAPGFFNLFKNYLLPICFYSIIFLYINKKLKLSKVSIIFYSIIFLILILGTGQRGPLIMSIVYLYLISNKLIGEKNTLKYITILGSLLFLVLIFATFALARGTGSSLNDLKNFELLSSVLLNRFIVTNQAAGLEAYRYILTYEGIQWGHDWIMSLEQILPGQSQYINLANKIFQLRYGSFRGTSPPTLLVSIYYNFGTFGIIIMPIILNFIFNIIYNKIYRKISCYSDFILYLIVHFAFSTWVISGLHYPVLSGLPILPLLIILKFIIRKNENFIYATR